MNIPTELNHYRILGQLGKGGMGEVYAAEDTKLHRKVALKVLSALMAGDPERRQRFEREAQAIAALNHPNIVTIYSVEEANGLPFLTMELVEGRPLNELIPDGGFPLDALLRIGISISDAIAAAHQRGITHRDLKPANVMVTPDGRAKVLDFGLAKLREAELDPDGLTRLPSGDLTGEGRIIGTVAYMSPEQAEGKTVDPRSDIFSLGVMLHELGSGERPFKGDTNVSVISSIIKDTPSSITDLNPSLPVGLAKIIRRALAKDPSRRYQTATDLRNELEELKQEVDSGVTMTMSAPKGKVKRQGRTGMWVGVAAVLVLVAAGIAAVALKTSGDPDSGPIRFEADRFSRLTNTGNAFLSTISGDGRYVVHIKNTGIEPSLWVRQTSTTSDVQIVPPARVRYDGLTYGPDGDYVYYVTYGFTGGVGTLYRVPVLGGTSQRVLEDVDSPVSFSPDGKQFAFTRGAPNRGEAYLMIAAADGSGVRQLASLSLPEQLQLTGPAWSPDGRTILATAQSLKGAPHVVVYAFDVASGSSRQIGDTRWRTMGDLEWMPDGGGFLAAAAEQTGEGPQIWQIEYPSGARRRVTNDLNNYVGASISEDGRTIATVQAENVSNLWILAGNELSNARQITSGRGRGDGQRGLGWTPDGRLVFGSAASGRLEIWIVNADGSNLRQLTNNEAPSVLPAASPDGRYVVFQRFQSEGMNLWRMSLDGSDEKAITTDGLAYAPSVGADSRTVFFYSPATGQPLPHKVSIDGGDVVKLSDDYFRPLQVSPDGRTLLGVGWDAAARRSALGTLPVEGGRVQLVALDVPTAALWAPGGQGITHVAVLTDGIALVNTPLKGGPSKELLKLRENIFAFAWSPDGKQLAVSRGLGSSDVVLVTSK